MAEEKDERSSSAQKRTSGGAEDKRPATGSVRGGPATGNGASAVAQRRQRYLVSVLPQPAMQMPGAGRYAMEAVVDFLKRHDGVEIVERVQPPGVAGQADGMGEFVVAKIEESKAEALRALADPHVCIERDAFLHYAGAIPAPGDAAACAALLQQPAEGEEVQLRLTGERDQPVAKASIVVYGAGFPREIVTDANGLARITLAAGPIETIRALYVRPVSGYWERFIRAPDLKARVTNTIRLSPLSETFPSLASERVMGWGQRLMRIGQGAPGLTGQGVRIGVIDSGCDNTHPQLRHLTRGRDFTDGGGEASWANDALGQGTHVAGLVGAADADGPGIRAIAPEAELHVFKVVPGGRLSHLIAALDECLQRELDIVCIGVGVADSAILHQRLMEARRNGIACIAAAGDFGGPVQSPALVPGVMAVSAVGKMREFPANSGHAISVLPQLLGEDGVFAAAFSCFGPQVSLAAPGVAILSTAAGGGYVARDGSALAAAHASGMAALVLAHHPMFQGPRRARSEQRVGALFALMQASAVPRFADPMRGGAGVPDLGRVPGLRGQADAGAGMSLGAQPGVFIGPAGQVAGFETAGGFVGGYGSGMAAPWPAQAGNWQALMQLRAAGLI